VELKLMIIDVWMQHPTLRLFQHEMFTSLWRWTNAKVPTEEIPLASTIAAFREANVSYALTTAWCGPQGWLISNDEVAEFARLSQGFLKPVASADLRKPMEAVRQLRHAARELGCVALRVIPWLWGLPPDDRRYYPLFAECCELDIPFCTQVGHTGPLCASEPGRPIPYLDHVALEFPELRIIAGHIGFPWVNEMISLALKYPNVYIDTSAYTAKRFPSEFVAYLKGAGRKKVMFGTNYPMLTPAHCLKDLASLGLDEEATELFLSGNAKSIFRL
jgi:predicted TIM-barrel fold metal-dependent hydrolase